MTRARQPRLHGSAAAIGVVGVGTIVAGFVADLEAHLAPGGDAHGPGAHLAHAVVLIGMVLLLVAVVVDGHLGRPRRDADADPDDGRDRPVRLSPQTPRRIP